MSDRQGNLLRCHKTYLRGNGTGLYIYNIKIGRIVRRWGWRTPPRSLPRGSPPWPQTLPSPGERALSDTCSTFTSLKSTICTCSSALHCITISSITTASPWLRVPLQGLCHPRRLSGTQQMPPPWPEERGNFGSVKKCPNILSASTNMISMCKHLVGEFQHSVAVSFSAIFDLHVGSTDDYFTVLD